MNLHNNIIFCCFFATQLISNTFSIKNQNELENKIDIIAEKILSCKAVVGFSVGIIQNDTTLLTKGYGISNMEKNIQVNETTLFGIASLSKAFTATLVAKLLFERKDFHLDTPVREILGNDFYFADPVLTSLTSVRDLLSHRTGVPKYNRARMQDHFDRQDLVKKLRFFNRTKGFRTNYMYNNLMYGLVTRISEVIGGDSWENLMKTHIFDKLGMDSTTFTHETDLEREDMAVPYYQNNNGTLGAVSQKLHSEWGKLGGSGSIVSHAIDMTKWLKFQLTFGKNSQGEQVIPEEVMKETHEGVITIPECTACYYYRRPHSPETFVFDQYALGWRTGFYRGLPMVTHTGSSYGYTAKLTLIPDMNIGIHVSLTGNDPGYEARRAISIYIMDILMNQTPIVNLQNVCFFPYNNPKSPTNATEMTIKNNISSNKAMAYSGTYGNFGFGNLTVYFNNSLQRLQVKYGILGLWNLYSLEELNSFAGTGIGDVWNIKIKKLVFGEPNSNGQMATLVIPDFERENPPLFRRGLQLAEAEHFQFDDVCETTYSNGCDSIVCNAIAKYSLGLMCITFYFNLLYFIH